MSSLSKIENLNSHQLEILKLFSRELDDTDLIEIKRLIVRYLSEKITNMADGVWEKENWTNEDMERLLKTHRGRLTTLKINRFENCSGYKCVARFNFIKIYVSCHLRWFYQ